MHVLVGGETGKHMRRHQQTKRQTAKDLGANALPHRLDVTQRSGQIRIHSLQLLLRLLKHVHAHSQFTLS